MDTSLPSLFKTLKKPSDFIRLNEEKTFKISVSNENHVPTVIELEKEIPLNCSISLDRPLFQPEPSNLTIEGFTPFKTYELVISFRNVDKV
jgi:hydrocephalus-inducing protein